MLRRAVLKGLAAGLPCYTSYYRFAKAQEVLKNRNLYTDDWRRL